MLILEYSVSTAFESLKQQSRKLYLLEVLGATWIESNYNEYGQMLREST